MIEMCRSMAILDHNHVRYRKLRELGIELPSGETLSPLSPELKEKQDEINLEYELAEAKERAWYAVRLLNRQAMECEAL